MTTRYEVRAGTACRVRRVGGRRWRDHKTTKALTFDKYTPADNGGAWVFVRAGWELKVPPCYVRRLDPKPPPPARQSVGFGTFNRCVLGRNGRGASRRKNQRVRRRGR